MRNFLPFVQFKKCEKHPWKSVTSSKAVGRLKSPTLLKVTLLHDCFSRFSKYTNGTKSSKASHMKLITSEGVNNHLHILNSFCWSFS